MTNINTTNPFGKLTHGEALVVKKGLLLLMEKLVDEDFECLKKGEVIKTEHSYGVEGKILELLKNTI